MYYIAQTVFTPNDLEHYGVLGMKWHNHRQHSVLNPEVRKKKIGLKLTIKENFKNKRN